MESSNNKPYVDHISILNKCITQLAESIGSTKQDILKSEGKISTQQVQEMIEHNIKLKEKFSLAETYKRANANGTGFEYDNVADMVIGTINNMYDKIQTIRKMRKSGIGSFSDFSNRINNLRKDYSAIIHRYLSKLYRSVWSAMVDVDTDTLIINSRHEISNFNQLKWMSTVLRNGIPVIKGVKGNCFVISAQKLKKKDTPELINYEMPECAIFKVNLVQIKNHGYDIVHENGYLLINDYTKPDRHILSFHNDTSTRRSSWNPCNMFRHSQECLFDIDERKWLKIHAFNKDLKKAAMLLNRRIKGEIIKNI